MNTLLLTHQDLEAVAEMGAVVSAVEAAFAAHACGEAQMPPKVYLSLPEHHGDFRAMPSAMADAAGVKWVNSHPRNPELHGLPAVMGVYILSDPATAYPLAIMDGTLLTALRTGAAGAVASKHLAKPGAKTLGFVGCGVQSRYLLDAHRAVFGDSLEILCADLRDDAAKALAELSGGRVVSVQEAAGADIVCTTTPGRDLAVQGGWIASGAHVNAMGADAPGKQELASEVLRSAQIVIDEQHQAEHSGEINVPLSQGEIELDQIVGTLGGVIEGSVSIDRERTTIFDSTGLAIQDVAVAQLLAQTAKDKGLGAAIDLVGVG